VNLAKQALSIREAARQLRRLLSPGAKILKRSFLRWVLFNCYSTSGSSGLTYGAKPWLGGEETVRANRGLPYLLYEFERSCGSHVHKGASGGVLTTREARAKKRPGLPCLVVLYSASPSRRLTWDRRGG
jgi:hypothetical protein